MPGAIANASTLINLSAIGQLHLLQAFHEQVTITPAVWHEVVTEGGDRPGAQEVDDARQAGWIDVREPGQRELVQLLERELDAGEAESIALTVEERADVVFLDESDARQLAHSLALHRSGVIGILMRAKLEGKISSLKEALDRLQEEAGFWIDKRLYAQALEELGEL